MAATLSSDTISRYRQEAKKPADEQAKFFLRRYMNEFEGRFHVVLDQLVAFHKVGSGSATPLDEVQFMRFLDSQGRVMTRGEMKATFSHLDFDKDGGCSFLEWLVFNYEKTVPDLLRDEDNLPADLRAEVEAASADFQLVLSQERVFTDRIAELEKHAAAGGVKGAQAKAECETVKGKYDAEKFQLAKQRLAAEKKRDAVQQKVNTYEANFQQERDAKFQLELSSKATSDKVARAAEADARASKKAELQAKWETK